MVIRFWPPVGADAILCFAGPLAQGCRRSRNPSGSDGHWPSIYWPYAVASGRDFGEGVQRKSTLSRKGRALLGGCVLFAVLGKGEKHGEGRYRALNGDERAVGLRRGESPAKIFFN